MLKENNLNAYQEVVQLLVDSLETTKQFLSKRLEVECNKTYAVKTIKTSFTMEDIVEVLELIKGLQNSNPGVRHAAIRKLSEKRLNSGEPLWLTILEDDVATIQHNGNWLLGQIDKLEDKSRATPFLMVLSESKDKYVSLGAVSKLATIAAKGNITDPKVVPILKKALEEGKTKTCENAIIALGLIGKIHESPEIIEILTKLIQEPEGGFRNEAMSALSKVAQKNKITASNIVEIFIDVLQKREQQYGQYGFEKIAQELALLVTPETLPVLVEGLRSSDQEKAKRIAFSMTCIKDEKILEILADKLLKDLESDNEDLCCWAIRVLGTTQSSYIKPGSTSVAHLESDENCFGGYCTIEEPKKLKLTKNFEVISALIKKLEDPSPRIQKTTIQTFIKLADRRVTLALIKGLNNRNSDIQTEIINALGFIGDRRMISVLFEKLKDKNLEVRQAAAFSLHQLISKYKIADLEMLPYLVETFESKNIEIRNYAMYSINEILNQHALSGIIKAIENSNAAIRYCAALRLSELLALEKEPILIKALDDVDARVRETAITALGSLRKKQDLSVIKKIEKLLEDENVNVRAKAAKALGDLEAVNTLPALVKCLNDKEEKVRLNILDSLTKIAQTNKITDSYIIEIAVKTLSDTQAYVRAKAAELLAVLANPETINALKKAIKDDFGLVRANIVKALGNIGSSKALPTIVKAAKDKEMFVREKAVAALGQIKDLSASSRARVLLVLEEALRSPKEEIRVNTIVTLSKIIDKKVAVPILIRSLKDEETEVCKLVIETLGKMLTPQSKKALHKLVNDEDEDYYLRYTAQNALGKGEHRCSPKNTK